MFDATESKNGPSPHGTSNITPPFLPRLDASSCPSTATRKHEHEGAFCERRLFLLKEAVLEAVVSDCK